MNKAFNMRLTIVGNKEFCAEIAIRIIQKPCSSCAKDALIRPET